MSYYPAAAPTNYINTLPRNVKPHKHQNVQGTQFVGSRGINIAIINVFTGLLIKKYHCVPCASRVPYGIAIIYLNIYNLRHSPTLQITDHFSNVDILYGEPWRQHITDWKPIIASK